MPLEAVGGLTGVDSPPPPRGAADREAADRGTAVFVTWPGRDRAAAAGSGEFQFHGRDERTPSQGSYPER